MLLRLFPQAVYPRLASKGMKKRNGIIESIRTGSKGVYGLSHGESGLPIGWIAEKEKRPFPTG